MENKILFRLLGLHDTKIDSSQGRISLYMENSENLENTLTVLGRDPEAFKEVFEFLRYPSSDQLDIHKRILGEKMSQKLRGSLMGTQIPSERQFRLWYGIPASLDREHVDSCGENLVMSVDGASEYVNKVKNVIYPPLKIVPIVDTLTGVKIYLARSRILQ